EEEETQEEAAGQDPRGGGQGVRRLGATVLLAQANVPRGGLHHAWPAHCDGRTLPADLRRAGRQALPERALAPDQDRGHRQGPVRPVLRPVLRGGRVVGPSRKARERGGKAVPPVRAGGPECPASLSRELPCLTSSAPPAARSSPRAPSPRRPARSA